MTAVETVKETLALPSVDLNRGRREERRQVLHRSRRHGAALLAIIAVAGAALVPLTLRTVALTRDLRKCEGQVRGTRARLSSVTAMSARMDARVGIWERLVQTQQSRKDWGSAFPSLAACLPQDVFLREVHITGKGRDTEIQIQGSARTMAGLRAFTTALTRSPVFARVHLDEATADHNAGHGGLSFRLAGPVSMGAAAGSP